MSTLKASLLIYDIPQTADIPNPSDELRGTAVRINLSCWVILENDIPLIAELMTNLRASGSTVYTLPFYPAATRDILARAVQSINEDIQESTTRLVQSINRAIHSLRSGREAPMEAIERCRRNAEVALRRQRNILRQLTHAARRFGIAESNLNLRDATHRAERLRIWMEEKVTEYLKATAELAKTHDANHPMMKAAQNGQIPGEYLADYMQENEVPGADRLRGLFLKKEDDV